MSIVKKSFVLFVGVVIGAMLGVWSGVALAGEGETIYGCVDSSSGKLRVIEAGTPCKSWEYDISWNKSGPPGPPGTFTGHFESPNGLFSIDVTDSGITLAGPSGTIALTGTAVQINSLTTLQLSGANTSLSSSGPFTVHGLPIQLGAGECRPVSRLGDTVQVNLPGGIGTITTGSTSVLICQ